MFTDWNSQYCQDGNSPQTEIQYNPYQNLSKIFCKKWQAYSKIYMEMQKF